MGDTQRPLSAAALAAAAGTVSVSVPHLPAAQAVRAAVAHYNERRSPGSRPAALTSNPQFLARITVNYLRHAASTYDHTRNVLTRHGDADTAGKTVKLRTLQAIAAAYPWLAGECARQNAEHTAPGR